MSYVEAKAEILRALGEELAARIGEGTSQAALATLRADVRDGLVPGATLADVATVATARGLPLTHRGRPRRREVKE